MVAAGAWSPALAPAQALPVRPVKGQILELRARGGGGEPLDADRAHARAATSWAAATGAWCSAATMEEQGFDTTVTAGGVHRLLEHAWEVVPETGELELRAGRGGPAARHAGQPAGDRARATCAASCGPPGHWRNGVLLAPLTGEVVAELLADGRLPEVAAGLGAERFATAEAPA